MKTRKPLCFGDEIEYDDSSPICENCRNFIDCSTIVKKSNNKKC